MNIKSFSLLCVLGACMCAANLQCEAYESTTYYRNGQQIDSHGRPIGRSSSASGKNATSSSRAYFSRAYSYARKGLYNEAISDFTSGINLDPNNSWAYEQRSKCYALKKQYQYAISDITKAVALLKPLVDQKYKLGKAYVNRAKYYAAADDHSKAISDFTEAIKVFLQCSATNPSAKHDASVVYSEIGYLQLADNNADLAISNYKKAQGLLGKNESSSPLMVDFGNAYLLKKDFAHALQFFQQAIDIDPRNDTAYNNLGVLYVGKRDFEKALPFFQKSVVLNPRYGPVYASIGMIYLHKGELDAAVQNLNRALQMDSTDSRAWIGLSDANVLLNHLNDAIADAGKAIALKNEKEGYGRRARAYLCLEDYDKCIEDAKKTTEILPHDKWAFEMMTYCFIGKNDIDSARQTFDKCSKIDESGTLSGFSYLVKASMEVQDKKFSEAISDCNLALKRLVSEDDNIPLLAKLIQPDIYYVRATAYEGLNDKKNALADYQHIAELFSNESQVLNPHQLKYKELALKKISTLENIDKTQAGP